MGQLAVLVVGIAYLGGGLGGMVFTGLSGFTRSSGTQLSACNHVSAAQDRLGHHEPLRRRPGRVRWPARDPLHHSLPGRSAADRRQTCGLGFAGSLPYLRKRALRPGNSVFAHRVASANAIRRLQHSRYHYGQVD